jgi:hypothetical protein
MNRDRILRAVAARKRGRAKVRSATTAVGLASVVAAGAVALGLPGSTHKTTSQTSTPSSTGSSGSSSSSSSTGSSNSSSNSSSSGLSSGSTPSASSGSGVATSGGS